jgi:hypothetical protein
LLKLRGSYEAEDEPAFILSETDNETTWVAAAGAAFFAASHVAITGEVFYSGYHVSIDLEFGDGSTATQSNSSELYGLQFGFRIFLF